MTLVELQQLKALIVATSAYYGQTLGDAVLGMYVEDLADLDFTQVVDTIKVLRRDPKNRTFPIPAIIRDRIKPADLDEHEARDAASRIVTAVSSYGPYQYERAKAFIGELGWFVVKRQGGWTAVCLMLTRENQSTLQAQWRDLAGSFAKLAKAGQLNQAPEMPKREITGAVDVKKLLPEFPK